MALALTHHKAMLRGFAQRGFIMREEPTQEQPNPLILEVHQHDTPERFRIWAFALTHGGGGPTVRAEDEFRIQITNGPTAMSQFDTDDTTDLLVGYSPTFDTIVAYDRRWLERWTGNKERTGAGGSPSVQVRQADIKAGQENGVHHLTKDAAFGRGDVVTMHPNYFPAFLANHDLVLAGRTTATELEASDQEPPPRTVSHYCASQGFPFPADLLARYVASLIAKPFVILAGVSGTGKSKLPQLVAEFYGHTTGSAKPAPPVILRSATSTRFVVEAPTIADRFALVPVRPDWTDNQSILGFLNPITNEYASTQALDLILRAKADSGSSRRFFMLLDEMNLARVEHYFSDWLACTESRRLRLNGKVIQHGVPLHRSTTPLYTTIHLPGAKSARLEVPSTLKIPVNLVVTGTVNVDETTYGFSPKVLDRAMVLEFDDVDLHRLRSGPTSAEDPSQGYRFPPELPPFQLPTPEHFAQLPESVHERLDTIHGMLEKARLHFGYRTANEIALFMITFHEFLPQDPADPEDTRDANWTQALDAAILQKVLPRLSGNRPKLEALLATLAAFLRDGDLRSSGVANAEYDGEDPKARLPRSYRRSVEMLNTLRGFGFVTFFK